MAGKLPFAFHSAAASTAAPDAKFESVKVHEGLILRTTAYYQVFFQLKNSFR